MRQALARLTVETQGKGLVEITGQVREWLAAQKMCERPADAVLPAHFGIALIQENADPDVRRDLEDFFARLVPEGRGLYVHDAEGPDDMPCIFAPR